MTAKWPSRRRGRVRRFSPERRPVSSSPQQKVAYGEGPWTPPLRLARSMTRTAANGPRSGENRARLLQLSATLFATQGYAQVSVRDLAARLGVTTGALYSNFRSKGDLLAEVLEVRIREDMERSQRSQPDLWLPEAVHESFLTLSERLQMRALLLEAGAAARTDRELRESLRPPLTALIDQWIEDYRVWQQFGKVDPDVDMATLLPVLWAIELGIGVLEAQGAVRVKPAALADFVGTFLQALEGHGGTWVFTNSKTEH